MEFGFAGAREDDMAKLSGQFDSTVKDLNKLCGSDNDLKKALDIAVNIIRE